MTGMRDANLRPTGFGGGLSVTEKSDVLASNQLHAVTKYFVTRFEFGDGTSETDMGFDLPATAIVLPEIFINVITAEATGGTKTIDVGLLSSESGGDADGFVDGISVAATGIVEAGATVTAGGTETYYSANTLGVLLSTFLAGANVATDVGTFEKKKHLTSSVTAKSISITPGSADFAELVVDVYIPYITLETM